MKRIFEAAMMLVLAAPMSLAQGPPELRDVELIMGPDACAECHKAEAAVWQQTQHYDTFFSLTRTQKARDIAAAMGLRRIKRESDCMNCHFTSMPEEGVLKPMAGISCESCHGPAKKWIKVHNDFGGKDVTREQETPEHREQRLKHCQDAGMIRPDDLYALARNCFQCHTVPHEKLVNVGGHTPGSDFELVAWSQGKNRHNFMRSKDGKTNQASTPEQLRILYVIGRVLDLEYSMRAVALATTKDAYAVAMARRVQRAIQNLAAIQEASPTAQVASMIEIAKKAPLKLNRESELQPLCDQVSQLAREFAASHDGSQLSGIDALLPSPDQIKGTPMN